MTKTNPFTGEAYRESTTDYGIECDPKQFSFEVADGAGVTADLCLGTGESRLVEEAMKQAAIGLSQMTGFEIEYRDLSSPAAWGNFGKFIVRNPHKIPAIQG